MDCLRCQGPVRRYDSPLPDGGAVWIDRCERAEGSCGVWYDGNELAALHPAFSDPQVESVLGGSIMTGDAAPGALACPRCSSTASIAWLTEVRFAGVALDCCASCRGLWVDTAEYAALMAAMRLHAPGATTAPAHYRSLPTGPTMVRTAVPAGTCVACGVGLPWADLLWAEDGLRCARCAAGEASPGTVPVRSWLGSLSQALRRLLKGTHGDV